MTNEQRKTRLNELMKNCRKKMKKIENDIEEMWDFKKNKAKKGHEEDIEYLKKDLHEYQTILDTYEFIEYELDI